MIFSVFLAFVRNFTTSSLNNRDSLLPSEPPVLQSAGTDPSSLNTAPAMSLPGLSPQRFHRLSSVAASSSGQSCSSCRRRNQREVEVRVGSVSFLPSWDVRDGQRRALLRTLRAPSFSLVSFG